MGRLFFENTLAEKIPQPKRRPNCGIMLKSSYAFFYTLTLPNERQYS